MMSREMHSSFKTYKISLYFVILFYILSCNESLKYAQIKSEWSSWQGCIDFHFVNEIYPFKQQALSESLQLIQSIDLGFSKSNIILNSDGLCLPMTKLVHTDTTSKKSQITTTTTTATTTDAAVTDEYNLLASWDELEMIMKKKTGCYALYDDGSKPWHISTLSETTGIPASLYPPLESTGAPTMVLGGFTMHRIVGENMNPFLDTVSKLECVPIFKGARVLDTCCGLGYTAIAAAKRVAIATTPTIANINNNKKNTMTQETNSNRSSGSNNSNSNSSDSDNDRHNSDNNTNDIDINDDSMTSATTTTRKLFKNKSKNRGSSNNSNKGGQVTTIEFDDASLEMCAYNPWSQGLFDQSLPIQVLQGDSCEIVKEFPDKSFNVVIHDPPARNLCRTDLYSLSFYQQLRRILTSSGTLYHYIGNPSSKESGRLYSGIIARLQQAGFENIKKAPKAFGVIATAGVGVGRNGAFPTTSSSDSSSSSSCLDEDLLQYHDDDGDNE